MTDPILIAIASAAASNAVASVYDFLKNRFGHDAEADRALEAAQGAQEDGAEVAKLAEVLARMEQQDPGFGEELRHRWSQTAAAYRPVSNTVSGDVHGKVVQAGDVHGDISL